MTPGNDPEKKPVGDSIRDLINPALADDRKQKIQLAILDSIFFEIASSFPEMVSGNFRSLFNRVASQQTEAGKNAYIINLLTQTDRMGNPLYSPIMQMRLPITPDFTEFSPDEIRALPNYIRLHEAARDANVALRLEGITASEAKGLSGPPRLTIDCSKTYDDGAAENASLYPNLPELPSEQPQGRQVPKSFTFGSDEP